MKKNEKNIKKEDNKKGNKKSLKMKNVEIDINDVLGLAKKIVTEGNGGIGIDSVNYIGDIKSLKFTIPDMTENGKCNNICPPEQEDYDKDAGCGETGGSCICGEKEGHDGDCICKLCGHEF